MAFSLQTYLAAAGDPTLSRITDLRLVDPDGAGPQAARLYATNRYDGAIWAWDLSGPTPQLLSMADHLRADGAGAVAEIAAIPTTSGVALVSGGGGGAALARFSLGADGALASGQALGAGPSFASDLRDLTVLGLQNGQTALYGALSQGGGIGLMRFDASGNAVGAQSFALGQITALAHLDQGGAARLFAIDGQSNSLRAFDISATGGLSEVAQIGAQAGLALSQGSALVAVSGAGGDFLIAAGAGSNSLSVVAVQADGSMALRDHVIDSAGSFLDGARVLATATHGQETFLFAAGSDDGISAFRLLPEGRLVQIGTIADSAAMGLQDISAIAATSEGDHIALYVSSGIETGLTVLRFDAGPAGEVLVGGAGQDTISGSAGADILDGGAGSDVLSAGAGDDILRDGAGVDVMNGGAGRDIFALSWDGMADYITGFERGVDRLDLSDWVMLRSADQLTLTSTSNGIDISYRGEYLSIRSLEDTPITAQQLRDSLSLTPDRFLPEWVDEIVAWQGRPTLPEATAHQGALGNTRFLIDHEGDTITGEIGFSQGGGIDTVETWIDYTLPPNIEILRMQGTASLSARGNGAPEALVGNAGNNFIHGGWGNDQINGKSGHDVLVGGRGADTLVGEDGADIFRYESHLDSPSGAANRDFINGFEHRQDKIDFTALDGNLATSARDGFAFIGNAGFSGVAGQVRSFSWGGNNFNLIEVDLTGNRQADMQIFVNGTQTMFASDFLFG